MGEAVVVVLDEVQDALVHFVQGTKRFASQQATDEHRKPALDGIEPAGMLGRK